MPLQHPYHRSKNNPDHPGPGEAQSQCGEGERLPIPHQSSVISVPHQSFLFTVSLSYSQSFLFPISHIYSPSVFPIPHQSYLFPISHIYSPSVFPIPHQSFLFPISHIYSPSVFPIPHQSFLFPISLSFLYNFHSKIIILCAWMLNNVGNWLGIELVILQHYSIQSMIECCSCNLNNNNSWF